ncbi:hypothetical protein [Desulfosarcina widdelii]|nr:hypothetical protein [Desulfosarcina widdelii]
MIGDRFHGRGGQGALEEKLAEKMSDNSIGTMAELIKAVEIIREKWCGVQ